QSRPGGRLFSLLWERDDLYLREMLAVALFLVVAALLSVSEDDDLLVATLFNELCGDFGAVDVRGADLCGRAVVNEENFVEHKLIARFVRALQLLDAVNAALGDEVLLTARFDDGYLCHSRGTIPDLLLICKRGLIKKRRFNPHTYVRYTVYVLVDLGELFVARIIVRNDGPECCPQFKVELVRGIDMLAEF